MGALWTTAKWSMQPAALELILVCVREEAVAVPSTNQLRQGGRQEYQDDKKNLKPNYVYRYGLQWMYS